MPIGPDLVVVIPGIMGSTLLDRNGAVVWGPSVSAAIAALLSQGGTVDRLALPDDVGTGGASDGIVPGVLMPDVQVIPGLWTPVKGYTRLIESLRSSGLQESTQQQPGRLLLFPYDWRLSNVENARRLDAVVTPALDRLRGLGGQYAEAGIRFVCHSMGGLVARAWIAFHDGASRTRRLITLGTPYRGAALALDQLVHGVRREIGPVHLHLDAFTRSLPSVYELLPTYACIRQGGSVASLHTAGPLPNVDADRLAAARQLHLRLEAAEAADPGTRDRRYLIVGSDQPTPTTATIDAGGVTFSNDYPGGEEFGDGTVPAVAGPKGLATALADWHAIPEHHGNLQRNDLVLREVTYALGRNRIAAFAPQVFLSATVPDLVMQHEPLIVDARSEQADVLEATVTDEAGAKIAEQHVQGTTAELVFVGLPPGVHTVTVTGRAGPFAIDPVTSTAVVWPSGVAGG